jgi:hypothetical protein
MTVSGIEEENLRLEGQCLNKLRHRVLPCCKVVLKNLIGRNEQQHTIESVRTVDVVVESRTKQIEYETRSDKSLGSLIRALSS